MTTQESAPFTPRPEGPDFIGIGVPRSGTTWLAECLAQHPQVYIHTKEIAFFTRHFYKGYRWYHNFFRDKGTRFAGDMTPSYFITPRDSSWKKEFYPHFNPRRALLFWQRTPAVRDEIVRKYPGIKVFVLFRDPAERAWSHYWKWRNRKDKLGKRYVPFEKMFEEDGRWLRSTGYYDLFLERWRSVFPEMGVFFFDDLKADGRADGPS